MKFSRVAIISTVAVYSLAEAHFVLSDPFAIWEQNVFDSVGAIGTLIEISADFDFIAPPNDLPCQRASISGAESIGDRLASQYSSLIKAIHERRAESIYESSKALLNLVNHDYSHQTCWNELAPRTRFGLLAVDLARSVSANGPAPPRKLTGGYLVPIRAWEAK